MRNSMQIVLFFEQNSFYNPTKVASLLNEKISKIGSPIILPIDMNAPIDANIPIILFNQSDTINITSNFQNISITLFDDMIEKYKSIINIVFDCFSENVFVRIGTIINNIIDSKKAYKDIKKETACNDYILNSKDFKISWLEEQDLNGIKINLWRNYFSDKTNTNDILQMVDFNTKFEEKTNVTEQFALDFIEECIKNM